jgi:hypothetical protein
MTGNQKKHEHPITTLEEFKRRIRVYDALGMLLCGPTADNAFHPADIGAGLIRLVEDFEAAWEEVQAYFDAEREAAGGAR